MPPLGTAPRLVNGRWVTRSGRVLSAGGQAYWTRKKQQGIADGKGHFDQGRAVAAKQAGSGPRIEPARKGQTQYVAKHPTKKEDVYSARIKQAGFGKGVLDKVAAPFSRPLTQIGQSMYYSPAGVYASGRAGVKDVGAAAHGDLSFKRSRKIGRAVVHSTAEDFRHPLRNSGYLALDVSAAVSGGAGAASRVAAVTKVAREGGALGQLARAAAHAPEPQLRTLRQGKLEAHPLESRNKAFALVQRAHDKYVNTQAAKNPEGRIGREYLPKRIGKTLAEERRVVTEPGAKAPAGALQRAGKKLNRGEQYALRVVAEQHKGTASRVLTLGERQAFHQAQGDVRQARLTQAASRYLEDTPQGPKIKPRYRELRSVYDRLVSVAGGRDSLLKSLGKLEEETAAGRLSGPAQVIGGAEYEKPTPGKLGQPSSSLLKKRQRVERLQAVYDRALARAKERYPEHPVSSIHKRGEVYRNRQDLVPRERRNEYRDLLNDVDRISFRLLGAEKISKSGRAALMKQRTETLDRAQALERVYQPKAIESPTVVRLGGALSVAKDELASHESAAAKRVKPTGIVGADELAGSGEVRIPYAKENAAKALLRPGGIGRGKTIGGVRKPASLRNAFTGALLKKGGGRHDVTRLVAESNVEAQKLGEALHVRDQLREAAVPHPPERGAEDYVAMRLDNPESANLSPKVRALIDDATRKREEGIRLSREERKALRGQFEEARNVFLYGTQQDITKLSPAEQEQFSKLYEDGKIGWVNRRLLGGLDQQQQLVGPGVYHVTATMDAINNATRFAVLYLKPAYAAPNVLGNAALNLVQQGFAAPANLARSARVNAHLSHDALAKMDAQMGEGFVRAISGEGGLGRKVVDFAANAWSKGVDIPFRRSAFLYEARRALRGKGLKPTWENIDRLLTDEEHAQTLSGVVRRANREIIDYGNLNGIEREIVRRLVFFYPWVKGSTVYAGRFALEHPVKAAATAKVGEEGKKYADATLGPVPSRYEGAFGAGGRFVNPASAAILGTPAQVIDAARGVVSGDVKPAAKLAQFATPALGLGVAELTRSDPTTGFAYPTGASALDIAKDQLVSGLPQASLVRNLKGDYGKILKPTRGQAIGKFGLGGLYPENYDQAALDEAARKEQRTLLTPLQRTVVDAKKLRDDFLTAGQTTGQIKGQLPKPLRDATVADAKIKANYARAGLNHKDPNYQQDAFEIDVKTLLKWGKITQAQADIARHWAASQTPGVIQSERDRVRAKYFGGAAISDARAKLRDGAERAAFTDQVTELQRAGKISTAQAKAAREWASTADRKELGAERARIEQKYGLSAREPVAVP